MASDAARARRVPARHGMSPVRPLANLGGTRRPWPRPGKPPSAAWSRVQHAVLSELLPELDGGHDARQTGVQRGRSTYSRFP